MFSLFFLPLLLSLFYALLTQPLACSSVTGIITRALSCDNLLTSMCGVFFFPCLLQFFPSPSRVFLYHEVASFFRDFGPAGAGVVLRKSRLLTFLPFSLSNQLCRGPCTAIKLCLKIVFFYWLLLYLCPTHLIFFCCFVFLKALALPKGVKKVEKPKVVAAKDPRQVEKCLACYSFVEIYVQLVRNVFATSLCCLSSFPQAIVLFLLTRIVWYA